MNDYLQTVMEQTTLPLLPGFILGLLTAISPCPLATNITAIGYISKDIESRRRIFFNGVLYALGRVIAYSLLGVILISLLRQGSNFFLIQKTISQWGERLISPILIVVGLFMLFGHKLPLRSFGFSASTRTEKLRGSWGSLLLGILFALAFCPTSGVFYFGMLIPMSAVESGGYGYPMVFALATGLPVLLVAWVLAFSVGRLGRFYNRLQVFQKWFNRVVALLFIAVGVYYGAVYLF